MIKNEGARVWVNRALAFLFGGLIVLIIMSVVVVAPLRSDKQALAKELDEVQHGAERLLAEAKTLAESKSYESALKTLSTLFEKQPGSTQMVEGRKLYTEIEIAIQGKQQAWEAAVGPIRSAWEKATAAELLAKAERERELVETGMAETLAKEWDRVKDKIRRDWENQ